MIFFELIKLRFFAINFTATFNFDLKFNLNSVCFISALPHYKSLNCDKITICLMESENQKKKELTKKCKLWLVSLVIE